MNLHKPFVYFPNLLTDRQCDDIIKLKAYLFKTKEFTFALVC